MSGEKNRRKNRSSKIYAVGAVVLAALIFAAFFAPQLIFHIQDNLLCRENRFDIQEEQDITLLSTSYETSLYNRLLRFAEDEQTGAQMYVTARELTPNQELEEFLHSDIGLQQDVIWLLADSGMIPYELLEENQYRATEWKQYVIYSEDYNRGVNFIIWYVRLESTNGFVYRLLLDAQTGSVYGIQSDNSAWLAQQGNIKVEEHITLSEFLGISIESETDGMDAWTSLAYYFGGFQEKEYFVTEMEERYENLAIDGYLKEPYLDKTDILWSKEYVSKRVTDNEVWYSFTFPYGEYSLDFRIRQDSDVFFVEKYYNVVVDMTIGFPDIYELIPEFGE